MEEGNPFPPCGGRLGWGDMEPEDCEPPFPPPWSSPTRGEVSRVAPSFPAMMRAILLESPELDAYGQMALDDAVVGSASSGELILRFYRWPGGMPHYAASS